jgi:hypothetical protein
LRASCFIGPNGGDKRPDGSEDDVRPTSSLLGKVVGVLALAGVAATLAACGGEDSAASEGDVAAKAEAARLKLEQCLRENGVKITTSDGGRRTMMRADGPRARGAMQKCRKFQEAAFGTITPEQRAEFRDAFTKFAACMRQHGVDLPDPTTARPQARRGAPRAGARMQRDDPKTQAAMKACEDKLPKGGPGGGPGVRLAVPGGAKAP